MAAAINSALNLRGSNFSFLARVRDHRRSREAAHAKRSVQFDELTAPHAQKLFRIAYRITRNREDAEDALQDAFLQALVHFEDFDGRSAFSTWLTRITINSSLMLLRKRKSARTVSLDAASDSEEPKNFLEISDPAPLPEQRYLQKERETTLWDAISDLRPSLRSAVELGHFGERSMRETAEIMGLSVCAAKARLFHARAALRKSRKLRRFHNSPPARLERSPAPHRTQMKRGLMP